MNATMPESIGQDLVMLPASPFPIILNPAEAHALCAIPV